MFAEDLSLFLEDFGETVTLGGIPLQAIFDNAHQGTGLLGVDFESRNPTLRVKDADLPSDAHDLPVRVRGVDYEVVGVEPDGTGLSVLQLRRPR